MQDHTPNPTPVQTPSNDQSARVLPACVSPAYVPPTLTPLGAWQTLTLIVSVPIGPGGTTTWGDWN